MSHSTSDECKLIVNDIVIDAFVKNEHKLMAFTPFEVTFALDAVNTTAMCKMIAMAAALSGDSVDRLVRKYVDQQYEIMCDLTKKIQEMDGSKK